MKKTLRKLSSLTMALFMVLQVILPAFPAKAEDLDSHHITGIEDFKDDEDTKISRLKAYEIEEREDIDHDKFSMAIETDPTTSKFRLVLRNDLKLYENGYYESKQEASKEFSRVKKHLNDQGLDIDISLTEDENGFRILTDEEFEKFNEGKELENPYGENYSYIDLKVLDDFDFNEKGFLKDSQDLVFKLDFIRYESIDPNFNIFKIDQDGNLTIENEGDILALIKEDKAKIYTSQNLVEDFKLLDEYKTKKDQEKAQKEAEKEAGEKEEAEKKAQKEQEEAERKAQEEQEEAQEKADKEEKSQDKEENTKENSDDKSDKSNESEDENKDAKNKSNIKSDESSEDKSDTEIIVESDGKEIPIIKEDSNKEEEKSEEKSEENPKKESKEENKEDAKDLKDEKANKEELDLEKRQDKSRLDGLKDEFKDIFSKDPENLKKADKELKNALRSNKSLEEIQELLYKLGDKYKLNRDEQEKLMARNDFAIRRLVRKHQDKNTNKNFFMVMDNLENEKFTIKTRFKTSNINGPIEPYQYFKIHLDDKLMVKDPSSLEDIKYKGRTIARPSYDSDKKIISYQIVGTIPENIDIPINIDVDYDTDKIDENLDEIVIRNSVSGLGVVEAKALTPVIIDKNGNPKGSILESGGKDVGQILDQGKDYQVNMDAYGEPVVEDSKLKAINWTVKFTATEDLKALGLKANSTIVEGAGLGSIENLKANGEDETEKNPISDSFGIVDSVHHSPQEKTKDYTYTFTTPVKDVQESYMIDISVMLKDREKIGAKRLVFDKGYPRSKVKELTPNRVSMNNRTSIKAEFESDDTATWTITDAVSTGDNEASMPLETRSLSNNQSLRGEKPITMASYKLDEDGRMVVDQNTSYLKEIPNKGENPGFNQKVGNIAIYKINANLKDSDDPYTLSGVTLENSKNIDISQRWTLIDGKDMPAQTFKVYDKKNPENLLKTYKIEKGGEGSTDRQREFTIPNVKEWKITPAQGTNPVSYEKISYKIDQSFPENDGLIYEENINKYRPYEKDYYIYNTMRRKSNLKTASFTIVKYDKNNKNKKIGGAVFKLQSPNTSEDTLLTTGEDGRAEFKNILPGDYKLVEVKAPKGYKLDTNQKSINVNYNGSVSVDGENIRQMGGAVDGSTKYNIGSNSYPSYMNTLHYAEKNDNKVNFYVMLKPDENTKTSGTDKLGSTNKNTRFNIYLDGTNLEDVKIYDVSPSQRNAVVNSMTKQNIAENLNNLSEVGNGGNQDEIIIKDQKDPDPYTKKSGGKQIKIPANRFGYKAEDDWAFLVKLTGTIPEDVNENHRVVPSFDWLTDNNRTADEVKIQEDNIALKGDEVDSNVRLEIANESFKTEDVGLTKLIHDPDIRLKDNEKVLEGVEFTLKDKSGQVISNKLTDKDGKVNFGKLDQGRYIIEETQTPRGYSLSPLIFDVLVDESGQITYQASSKYGSNPIHGVDYLIENEEMKQEPGRNTEVIDQKWTLNEKGPDYTGKRDGVWEAYHYETLAYEASVNLEGVNPGSTFEIEFDDNLDFNGSVYNIPDIRDKSGKVIASPNLNYETNLLTYVFNDNVGNNSNVTAYIRISGIRPDMYSVLHSGDYSFEVIVDPLNANQDVDHDGFKGSNTNHWSDDKKKLIYDLTVDYGDYHKSAGVPDFDHVYKDVFKAEDGRQYVKAISYYNPTASDKKGSRWLDFDWMSSTQSGVGTPQAAGDPAFELSEVKVYKVLPEWKDGEFDASHHMPLSHGIRPETDPNTYKPVFIKDNIKTNEEFSESRNGIRMIYNPRFITRSGDVKNRGPLRINIPRIRDDEGYVIEHIFEITNPDKYFSTWRVFHMYLNPGGTTYYATGNKTRAMADQSQVEVPKFYTQRLKLVNRQYTPGKFSIEKIDQADRNTKLAGAEFELTNSKGQSIRRYTDSNGKINFTYLRPGDYSLVETKPPDKRLEGGTVIEYAKSNISWTINVSNNGTVTIREKGLDSSGKSFIGDDENPIKLEVTNKSVGSKFRVYKKGEDDKPLKGAEFKLTKQNDTQTFDHASSDRNGLVEFEKSLEDGTYILEEIKAPKGYKKLDKKWIVVVKDDKVKVYDYLDSSKGEDNVDKLELLKGTNWVNVSERPTYNWSYYNDNRWTGYTERSKNPYKLGSRIIAIDKAGKYVIQRYVINPEAKKIPATIAQIHREKPSYDNMNWYFGNEDVKVYKLNGPVTGFVEQIRLDKLGTEDITNDVEKSSVTQANEPDRLQLKLPETNTPLIVDVKIPYQDENAGVGTGMDLKGMDSTVYWKSDYYERVSDIVLGEKQGESSIGKESNQGAYVSEGSLDVTNEKKLYSFKIKKTKENEPTTIIEGASFTLTGPGDLKENQTVITDKNGFAHFKNLEPGKYRLEEKTPAPGYDKTDVGWDVYVKEDGKVFIKADRSKGWNKVDTQSPNEARTNKTTNQYYVDTAITDVNFEAGRYKQVFIVNKDLLDSMHYPVLEIYSKPEKRDINTQNTSVQIYSVVKGATPTSYTVLRNTNQMRYRVEDKPLSSPSRLQIPFTDENTYAMAVVVETDLPKEGPLGLALDYYKSSVRKSPSWAAESYTNQHRIMLEKESLPNRSTYNADLYSAYNLSKANERIDPLDYSHDVTRSINPIENRSAMLYSGLEFRDDLVTAPVRAEIGWEKVDLDRSDGVNTSAVPNNPKEDPKPEEKQAVLRQDVNPVKAGEIKVKTYYENLIANKEYEAMVTMRHLDSEDKYYAINSKIRFRASADGTASTEDTITHNPEYYSDRYVIIRTDFYEIGNSKSISNVQTPIRTPKKPNSDTGKDSKEDSQISDDYLKSQGYILMDKTEDIYQTGISNKQSGLELKITKVNTAGKVLEGAKFNLEKYKDGIKEDQRTSQNLDENFDKITAVSDKDGKLKFNDKDEFIRLKPGVYRLTETKQPDTYKPAASHWDIIVKEENGKLVARRIGPKETGASYPQSKDAVASDTKDNTELIETDNGIKYKSKITHIDPVERVFTQRIYVDLREYKGNGKVNVDIVPKHKREEYDTPGESPQTIKKGVKTAYRTTYAVVNPGDTDPDTIINSYDLYNENFNLVNTARWRPFDWGFDEDQLNLNKQYNGKKAVYIIDVEGYYDENILRDKALNPKTEDDEIKDNEKINEKIPDSDKMKLEMDVNFGKHKEFQQYVKFEPSDLNEDGSLQGLKDSDGYYWINDNNKETEINYNDVKEKLKKDFTVHSWQSFKEASYQDGAVNLGISPNDGQNKDEKYPRWLGKEGGRFVYVNPNGYWYTDEKYDVSYAKAQLSANISPLYTTSEGGEIIPDADMKIVNQEQSYNITFTKLGRDDESWENNSDELANNRIEGAVFKLQREQPGGSYVDIEGSVVASAFNGYIGFRDLKPGKYRLMEVKPPEGYKPVKDPIVYITIDHDFQGKAKVSVVENTSNGRISYDHDDADQGKLVDFVTAATAKHMGKIINEKPGKGKATIIKVDDDDNPITGAKFKLTKLSDKKENESSWSKEVTSDDGKLVFDKLQIGNYRLEEVEPAPGHKLTGRVWHFSIGGKDLDPYAQEVSRSGRDLSTSINFDSSSLNIVKPMGENQGSDKNTVDPNIAEVLEFTNEFKIDSNTEINPGDYFVLKLPDTINLHDISTAEQSGLDIFADGVGTIAKADYDKNAGTITYTFTNYAENFTLTDFSSNISAYIDIYNVKESTDNVDVSLKVGDEGPENKVNVNYSVDIAHRSFNGNNPNMTSKIIKYNQETGDFEQYFYINPMGRGSINDLDFSYKPDKNLLNPYMTVYKLRSNQGDNLKNSMPVSFGVNTGLDNNLERDGEISYNWLNKKGSINYTLNPTGPDDSYLIKITGKVNDQDKSFYRPETSLSYYDNWGRKIGVQRFDQVFFQENKTQASADLSIKAVNPKKEIKFKKVDKNNNKISLENAEFEVYKKDENDEYKAYKIKNSEDKEVTLKAKSDKNGLFTITNLGDGDYALKETKAPDGYTKMPGFIKEFKIEKGKLRVKKSDGKYIDPGDEEILVKNQKGEYPHTGGPGVWIGFAIIGLVLMLFAVWTYHKKKAKKSITS